MNLDLILLIFVVMNAVLSFGILSQQEETLRWQEEQLVADRKQLKLLKAQLDEKRKQNEYLKKTLERLEAIYLAKGLKEGVWRQSSF